MMFMEAAFIVLAAEALHADSAGPKLQSLPEQHISTHIASVRHDCTMVDEVGKTATFKLLQSGRIHFVGDYSEYNRTDRRPNFYKPNYQVLADSDSKFRVMTVFAGEPRRLAGKSFVTARDEQGDFAGIFRIVHPHFSSDVTSGSSIIMYLPREGADELTETLGGVCLTTRLEDKTL